MGVKKASGMTMEAKSLVRTLSSTERRAADLPPSLGVPSSQCCAVVVRESCGCDQAALAGMVSVAQGV